MKKFWQSKTFWVNVLAVIAIAVPFSQDFIKQYFVEAGAGWAFVNMVLRLVSKDKIELK